MAIKSITHLHRIERARKRKLFRQWHDGVENVKITYDMRTNNQSLGDFLGVTPKCPFCGGVTKFDGQATVKSSFYRCRLCDKISEHKEGNDVTLF